VTYVVESNAEYLPLLQQMNQLAYGEYDIPSDLRAKLQTIPPPDAERFVRGIEMLYARFSDLPPFGLKVLGDMADFASRQPWTRFNTDGKAARIVMAVRRELGEPGEWPSPEEDPDRSDPMFAVHLPEPEPEPQPEE